MMNGYIYAGDVSAYRVTMLRRDTRKGVAHVRIEACVSGEGTIPQGAAITVPLRRVSAI